MRQPTTMFMARERENTLDPRMFFVRAVRGHSRMRRSGPVEAKFRGTARWCFSPLYMIKLMIDKRTKKILG